MSDLASRLREEALARGWPHCVLLNEAAAALEGVRVPREPTEEMIVVMAGLMFSEDWRTSEPSVRREILELYAAMLAAAPKVSE